MLYRVFFLEGTEIHRNWLNVSKGGVGRSHWNAVPDYGEMETVKMKFSYMCYIEACNVGSNAACWSIISKH